MPVTRLFHDRINGPGDDITGCEILERVVVLHKRVTPVITQNGTLTANGLADQETILGH